MPPKPKNRVRHAPARLVPSYLARTEIPFCLPMSRPPGLLSLSASHSGTSASLLCTDSCQHALFPSFLYFPTFPHADGMPSSSALQLFMGGLFRALHA